VVSIKNATFKCQPSTPMHSFVSMRYTSFMEIDDKGGEVRTNICKCIMGKKWKLDMDKEGATLKNREGSKFFNKRSTQVEGASS